MFLDIALRHDPATRRCDIVFDGRGIVLDRTPATPLLASLGSERRAEPDDELPDGATDGSLRAGLNPRRGWAGDALARDGQRAGSRLWLLERQKQTEDVRLTAEGIARQAVAWLEEREALEAECTATWVRRNVMALTVRLGGSSVTVQRAVSG